MLSMSGTLVSDVNDVAMRLAPTPQSVDKQQVASTFSAKERSQNRPPPTNRPPIDRRATFARSSSFVKLRNFCSNNSALLYLRTSSTALQTSINQAVIQLKEYMLALAVYLCVLGLFAQLATCVYALTEKFTPPGLVFMVGSAVVIMSVYSHMIVGPTKREARGRQSRQIMRTSVLKKSD